MDEMKEKLVKLTLDQTEMILADPEMALEDRSQAMKDLANIVGKVAELQKIENEAYEAEQRRNTETVQKDKQLLLGYATAGVTLFGTLFTGAISIANLIMREKQLDRIAAVQKDPEDPILFTTPDEKAFVQSIASWKN